MNISFEGIGQEIVTFLADGNVKKGCAVKVSGSKTVSACADGDSFAGFAANDAETGAAAVIIHGYITASYTGAAPALGCTAVAADSAGGVKAAADGRTVIVCDVDTANGTVGMFI